MKEFIPWADELSVGIEEIDEQHKILVRLINKLYDETVKAQPDPAVVDGILNDLVQYTIIHFSLEESLFRIFDFPYYDAHKKQHEDLKNEVISIQAKFRAGEKPINLELIHFLRKWLREHIMGTDKKYTSFFLEKGLKGSWTKRSWIGKIWDSVYSK
ncbi:MAG: hemerythrin family protein [Candidatus Competibacteraceae bacterium]|nr:hemerythrin family protein [Candidatus Competibacteraceae bacterium]